MENPEYVNIEIQGVKGFYTITYSTSGNNVGYFVDWCAYHTGKVGNQKFTSTRDARRFIKQLEETL